MTEVTEQTRRFHRLRTAVQSRTLGVLLVVGAFGLYGLLLVTGLLYDYYGLLLVVAVAVVLGIALVALPRSQSQPRPVRR